MPAVTQEWIFRLGGVSGSGRVKSELPTIALDYLRGLQTLVVDAGGRILPYKGFHTSILRPLSIVLKNSPDLESLEISGPGPAWIDVAHPAYHSLHHLFASFIWIMSRYHPLKIKVLNIRNMSLEMQNPEPVIPHLKSIHIVNLAHSLPKLRVLSLYPVRSPQNFVESGIISFDDDFINNAEAALEDISPPEARANSPLWILLIGIPFSVGRREDGSLHQQTRNCMEGMEGMEGMG
ncbi:hypothetical protein D9758_011753 [Tetrapyrgos nigripes]|uniref:Uncharacterized protein n=1 Tax=Tetrapyrgos nigripes TaxID=182062 RepID=A0A8H5CXD9_9AGAR|nr:hypothetical protein D9758_011753 [Tetrapyrgos nigripes]